MLVKVLQLRKATQGAVMQLRSHPQKVVPEARDPSDTCQFPDPQNCSVFFELCVQEAASRLLGIFLENESSLQLQSCGSRR